MNCCVVWNNTAGQAFNVKCGVRQGGILSPFLFSIYIDALIDSLRQSNYGIFISDVFIGCILYADDIVLLSCTCGGLQKLVNICADYSVVWDIKFNSRKSLVCTFGGHCPQSRIILLNNTPLSWADGVKYLGCNFVCRTGLINPKQAVGKFYGSANNIMSVLGKNRNEMMAVHLVNAYCLPTLFYGCEVWSLNTSDMQTVKVAWNNAFRRIFNACWRESVKPLLFYCNTMSAEYIIDQRKITFFKRLLRSNNNIVSVLLSIASNDINALCAKYGIVFKCNSISCIKNRIWKRFTDNIVFN
jgi:hypothetical protein